MNRKRNNDLAIVPEFQHITTLKIIWQNLYQTSFAKHESLLTPGKPFAHTEKIQGPSSDIYGEMSIWLFLPIGMY